MTFFSLRRFMPSTFFIRWSSTNGPFLSGSLIVYFVPAVHDELAACACCCGSCSRAWAVPHGVTGWRPPEVLPSPPPCGWSTGFMTTPRLCGRLPSQRLRPALPRLTFSWSRLPTWPMVAMQSTVHLAHLARGQLQRRVVAFLGHQLRGGAGRCAPSGRPCPGCSSMLWTRRCRAGCSSAAARCRPGCRRFGPDMHVVARRSGRPAPGCSASRRPRSAAGRCAPSGWGRTRSPPPWPGCRSCRAEVDDRGTAACGRRRGAGSSDAARVLRPPVVFLASASAFCGRSSW